MFSNSDQYFLTQLVSYALGGLAAVSFVLYYSIKTLNSLGSFIFNLFPDPNKER